MSFGGQDLRLNGVNGNVCGRGKGQEIWLDQCIYTSCSGIVWLEFCITGFTPIISIIHPRKSELWVTVTSKKGRDFTRPLDKSNLPFQQWWHWLLDQTALVSWKCWQRQMRMSSCFEWKSSNANGEQSVGKASGRPACLLQVRWTPSEASSTAPPTSLSEMSSDFPS